MSNLATFAELGRIWRVAGFAEPIAVTDPTALRTLQRLLEEEAGQLQRLFDVTLDGTDTFRGKADQRISLGRSQTYEFRIAPDQMVYRLINADEVTQFTDTDEGWIEVVDFAAKKLNCKPGNVQCGGKCQDGKKNCWHNMTPAQKKAAQAAARKARSAAPATAPAPAATPAPASAPTPPPTPIAPPSPIKLNQTELDQKRADLVNRFGQKTVDAAEQNVKRILDDADIFVRVGSSDTLEKILGDRFRTSEELGTTANVPGLIGLYRDARRRVEEKTMGVDPNTPPSEKPIYGYLAGNDLSGRSHRDIESAYGSIAVKLRSDVKERSTFTGADSFKSGIASEVVNSGDPPPPSAASLVAFTRHGYDKDRLPPGYPSYYANKAADGGQLRSAARAKDIDDLVPRLAITGNAYVEAQVHGGVKPQDIAEIHFSPRGRTDRPSPAIAQFAKDNNVDLFVNGNKLSSQDLDDIITPKQASPRSQRLTDLQDALAKGDLDTVANLTEQIHSDASKVRLNPGERDHILKHLFAEAGYDGLPKVGTQQDLDNAVANGQTMMTRGVRGSVKFLDQFKTGNYHTGNGIYGNGTYVGHSGSYSSDGLTFKQGNSASGLRDAWNRVRTHSYIDTSTTNFRMALDKNAVVMTQKQMNNELSSLRSNIRTWAANQRQQIQSSGTQYTRSDVRRHIAETQKVEAEYAGNTGKPVRRRTPSVVGNDTYDVTVPLTSNPGGRLQPIRFSVTKNAASSGFMGSSQTEYVLTKADGTESRHRRLQDAIDEGVREHYRTQAAQRLGFPNVPAVGGSDAATAQALKDFDSRVSRMEEVLFDDEGTGSSGRYGVIIGVDAIALNNSYEPKRFMNLLNRSVVTVQDTPLDYKVGQRVGVGVA